MAQLNEAPQIQRCKAGMRPVKKHHLRTDMTPMVDLGFLLIAFFVMTTELSKPRKLPLNMPKDGPPMPIQNSTALTVLLTGTNTVFYYHGDWQAAEKNNAVYKTDLSTLNGIGKVIQEKQDYLGKAMITKEGREGLMLMIKPGENTPYSNVVDMLDETIINKVVRHALLGQDKNEVDFIKEHSEN